MKKVSIVTKSGVLHDEIQNLELLEKGDVTAIVQRSLGAIRNEIEEQKERISTLDGKISDLQQKIAEHNAAIGTLSENISEASRENETSIEDLNQKIESKYGAIVGTIAELKKTLCSDFIQKCSEDVQGYFKKLAEYAEKISRDVAALQNEQKAMDEQYGVVSALAQYFCDSCNADLKHREEELAQEAKRLSVLKSYLPQSEK